MDHPLSSGGHLSFRRKAKDRTANRLAIGAASLLALGLLVLVNVWQNTAWPDWSERQGTLATGPTYPLTTKAAPDLIVATAPFPAGQRSSQQLLSPAAGQAGGAASSQLIGAPTTEHLLPGPASTPQLSSQYVLLGAPTSLCWKNTERLEAAFPASLTYVHSSSTRPGPRYSVPARVCRAPGQPLSMAANAASIPVQLLSRAPSVFPWCASSSSACTTSQLFSLRYTVHAAAHLTLRYHVPPGIMSGAQLDDSLQQAFHPLMCGPEGSAVMAERLRQAHIRANHPAPGRPAPLLDAACTLLPGLLQLMGAIAAQGEASDFRWDPTLVDLPGKYNPRLWLPASVEPAAAGQGVASSTAGQAAASPEDEAAQAGSSPSLDEVAAAAALAARQSPNYLVVFAMFNAERVMPHFILQVLALVTYIPSGRVLVSCYESGSTDSTPQWLRLLQGLLDLLRIPNHFIIQGSLVRKPGQERIPFLAAVRNAALAPLHDPAVYAAALKRVGHVQDHAASIYPAHKIIFINDPFFSWQDMVRLAHYNADVACGLDIDFWLDKAELAAKVQEAQRQDSARQEAAEQDTRALLTHPKEQMQSTDMRSRNTTDGESPWRSATGRQRALQGWGDDGWFYDIWVARDLDGRRFETQMPLVTDARARPLLQAALPFPVQCCWNAAVVLNAKPFMPSSAIAREDGSLLSQFISSMQTAFLGGTRSGMSGSPDSFQGGLGLRFRSHARGECSASECSLLCNDLWRLNFSRMLVDPSVRMTYRPFRRAMVHETTMAGLPMLSWQQMNARMRELQVSQQDFWTHIKAPESVMCCPPEGTDSDRILWNQCFFDKTWRAPPNQGWLG